MPYLPSGRVLGTDVVQELLDYARAGCPSSWQFALVEDIRITFPDNEADVASFFSMFTHLLPEESYCYLLEAQRVVKPGGHIVFSFLEFVDSWPVFKAAYRKIRNGQTNDHLNTFIGRDAIQAWAQHLGMTIVDTRAATERYIKLSSPIVYDNGERVDNAAALGQSVCVLRNDKPAARDTSSYRWSSPGSYKIRMGSG